MTATPRGDAVDVLLFGRANVDLTVRVPHRPDPSRTVFSSPLVTTAGGKSLNQAVAVGRLGGRACLVANGGDDYWGKLLRATLVDANVDVTHFRLLANVTTGAAIVEVTPDGENYLVLAGSPATELTPGQVDDALAQTRATVLTVQLDMPPEPVTVALTRYRAHTTVVGNLVPHPELDLGLFTNLDVLVVNEHEAATVLAVPEVDPLAAARQLRRLGPSSVVVTAGARGAAYSCLDRAAVIGAAQVPVVDTTGAGDAFLGCLALALSRDVPLHRAVAHAVQTGTLAVQHEGAHLPAPREDRDPAGQRRG